MYEGGGGVGLTLSAPTLEFLTAHFEESMVAMTCMVLAFSLLVAGVVSLIAATERGPAAPGCRRWFTRIWALCVFAVALPSAPVSLWWAPLTVIVAFPIFYIIARATGPLLDRAAGIASDTNVGRGLKNHA